MAGETPNLMANGDIRPSRFVKLDSSADCKGLEADANEIVIGISKESGREPPLPSVSTVLAAAAGDPLPYYGDGETCLLELGSGGCSAGDRLKSDADGCGVVIATTGTTIQHIGARAMQAGAAGTKVRVQVLISSERPALT